MTRRRLLSVIGAVAMLCGSWAALQYAYGQQIHRNGFETMKVGWLKGGFDVAYREKTHAISDQAAHDGRHSEYLQFEVQQPTSKTPYIHYAYPTGKAVVGEELSAGLWLKSNRPGMQLMARVVLPKERDPQNLDHLMTTFIRGDAYKQIGQWQHLTLGRPLALAKQQQQLLQAQLKRPFDFTDAYIDGLILNVFGGPGPTEVWIDDIEVGPIVAAPIFQPAVRPAGPTVGQPVKIVTPRADHRGNADFQGNKLKVGNRPFLFRAIAATDTPLEKLAAARFNAVFLSDTANPALIREASDRGLWVVPMLKIFGADARPLPADDLAGRLARFNDAETLFLHLGNALVLDQSAAVARSASAVKELDPGRVIGGDVWDGMRPFSNTLNLVGVHRWPLMTTLEFPRYREWLRQRRELVNPAVFLWTSVQTHMPDELAQLIYDRSASGSFDEPVGPQAEQVQLLAYSALASGCRGLVFSSDRFLADSHQGRDRLLACALMNLELEMLEPLLAGADDAPEWVSTSSPDVKAAIIRSPHGVLILPIWEGPFSQFVPGQASTKWLTISAPPMPQSMSAWEVSAADVRHIKPKRVVGGTEVMLKEFGLTSAVVFTSNNDLVARFQEQAKGRRQLAAQWSHDMAAYELDKVLKVEDQLEKQGHTVPDSAALVADAQKRLKMSRQLWESRAFPEAYREAQRALRPLRILMRAQWEKAVRGEDSPVATPYSATFFTLPRYWTFMDQVKRSVPSANVLPGGDFEAPPGHPVDAWRREMVNPADLEFIAERVTDVDEPQKPNKDPGNRDGGRPAEPDKANTNQKDGKRPDVKASEAESNDKDRKIPSQPAASIATGILHAVPKEGKQCAMLRIAPRPKSIAPVALEPTVLALNSPEVRLRPGTLVRVSAWICIPTPIGVSADGALFYDSAGGEALAVRLNDPIPWKKYTFYRRVPASGKMQVTLALTGLGTVYFDDVRIEPLVPPEAAATAASQVVPAN